MEIQVTTGTDDRQRLEAIISNLEQQDDVSIDIQEGKPSQNIFPPLDDPVVQKITIEASYLVLKKIYTKLKDHIRDDLNSNLHISSPEIDRFKWELIIAETGYDREELTVKNVHTPDELGGLWRYEFEDQNNNTHELKIYEDDLSHKYRMIGGDD